MATKTSAKKATTEKVTTEKSTEKKKTPTVKKASKVKTNSITEEQIRAKAQEIYNKRMQQGLPGDAETDWIEAEKELLK